MRRSFSANSKCKNCELKDPLVRNNQGARDEILEMGKTAPIYIISTIQFALS